MRGKFLGFLRRKIEEGEGGGEKGIGKVRVGGEEEEEEMESFGAVNNIF